MATNMSDAPLQPAEYIDIVGRGYAAFNAGDFEAVVAVLHDDIVWDMSGAVPDGPVYVGHDGFRKFVKDAFTLWDLFRLEPKEFRVIDEHVLVLGWVELRVRDRELTVKPQWGWVWKVSDGKGVELRNHIRWEDAIADFTAAVGD